MAIIQSGVSLPTLWQIDNGSNAGRVTLYDSNGNELAGVGVAESLNNVLDALNEQVTINLSGQANTSIQLWGTVGVITVSFQANIDGINWFPVYGQPLIPGIAVSSASANGIWFVDTSGYKAIRAYVTFCSCSSTVVSMIADPEQREIFSGTNTIVGISQDNTLNSTSKLATIPAIASVSAPSWTDGYMVPLSVDTSGALRVAGANNLSVSSTFALPPAFATYMGARVSAVAPSYTDGYMNAPSLTANGSLRVDSSIADGYLASILANQINGTQHTIIDGYVRTNPNVIVTNFPVTQTISGTVTANAGTGNFNVVGTCTDNTTNSSAKLPVLAARANTSAPTWTDGYMVPLSVDGYGNLRVTGSNKAAISNITSVVGSTSSVPVLASNPNRVLATIFNAANKIMYVALASTASLSAYSVQIGPNSYYELPTNYVGAISAVWANGVSGSAMITEMSP